MFVSVLLLVILGLLVAGCKVKEEKVEEKPTPTVDTEVGEVESSVENVSQVEEEINVSELEELDEALAEIEW